MTRRDHRRALAAGFALLAAFAVAGCAAGTGSKPGVATPPGVTATAPASAAASQSAAASSAATAAPTAAQLAAPLSAGAKRYAKSIGGVSHRGETLYFIVGISAKSEAEAQAALDAATPTFGDMQSYFIVQKSDNFKGMRPGWWIVVEPYRDKKHVGEQMVFAQRGFPDAYATRATVMTNDPIPVYEDAVGL
jgi:hypothetical protein